NDPNLTENIIGNSNIYLRYSDNDNTFHRAKYFLDVNMSAQSTITVYTNNEGFVHIAVGNNDYFVTGQSGVFPYVNSTFYLGVPKFIPPTEPATFVATTGSIETTSDWTDITFQGLGGLTLTITGTKGYIAEPTLSGNTLSIRKTTQLDTTPAQVDFALTAQDQDNAILIIKKGDLGYTTVT